MPSGEKLKPVGIPTLAALAVILPKPFSNELYESSWTLDSNDDWQAPVTYPNVDEVDSNPVSITWYEPNQEWVGKTYTGVHLQTETDYVWNASSLEWNEV